MWSRRRPSASAYSVYSCKWPLFQNIPRRFVRSLFHFYGIFKSKSVYIFINFINFTEGDEQPQFTFPPDEFTSKKITTKILQQIEVIKSDSWTLLLGFSTSHRLSLPSDSIIWAIISIAFISLIINTFKNWLLFVFLNNCLKTLLFVNFQEPLALASGALPDWCEQLTSKCPFLIPFETRQLYFTCTAFGASR